MPLALREDLHWCVCGTRVVFLDVRLDRYFCLGETASETFLEAASNPHFAGDQALAGLVSRELLSDDPRSNGIRSAPRARELAGDVAAGDGRLFAIGAALAGEARAAWLLKTRSLLDLLALLRHRAARAAAGRALAAADLGRIAGGFAGSALLLGSTDRCLVRAIAAFFACSRAGTGARLTFGVRLNPFGAHCWVEAGDRVLVGGFEHCRLYTPILVVE